MSITFSHSLPSSHFHMSQVRCPVTWFRIGCTGSQFEWTGYHYYHRHYHHLPLPPHTARTPHFYTPPPPPAYHTIPCAFHRQRVGSAHFACGLRGGLLLPARFVAKAARLRLYGYL